VVVELGRAFTTNTADMACGVGENLLVGCDRKSHRNVLALRGKPSVSSN
jgi:hypothetical protein